MFLHADHFLGGGNGVDGHVIVAAVFQDDQTAMDAIEDQVESKVAVSHGYDGIDSVGIAATDEVAKLLVDAFDLFAIVEVGLNFRDFFGNQVANSAEFFVAEGIRGALLENHFAAFKHRTFRNQDDGIATGIATTIVAEQFGELFDIEFVFGDDTTIGGASHGGKHGGKTGVAAEDFEDHETLVRTRRGAESVGHLNGARDAGAKADAVVGARDVVVHGLGNSNDANAFLVQTDSVTEGVVTADGNHVFDAEPGQGL